MGTLASRDLSTPIAEMNIVVAVDFAESGDHALWQALILAKRQAATTLHVVHVVRSGNGAGSRADRIAHDEDALVRAPEELHAYIEDHSHGVFGPHNPRIYAHVRLGEPADA